MAFLALAKTTHSPLHLRHPTSVAAFESAEHHLFGAAQAGEMHAKPTETGVHGLWPGRRDYSASLIFWGNGLKAGRKPRASMLTLAPRFARVLGLNGFR